MARPQRDEVIDLYHPSCYRKSQWAWPGSIPGAPWGKPQGGKPIGPGDWWGKPAWSGEAAWSMGPGVTYLAQRPSPSPTPSPSPAPSPSPIPGTRTLEGTVYVETDPNLLLGRRIWSMGIAGAGRPAQHCQPSQLCPSFLTVTDDRNGTIVAGLLNTAASQQMIVRVTGDPAGQIAGTPLLVVLRVVFVGEALGAREQGLTADMLAPVLREAGWTQDEIDAYLMALDLA